MEEQISKNDTSFDDEINYESFVKTQEEYEQTVEKGNRGLAILKSSELVDNSEVSEPYRNRYEGLLTPQYLVFEAELIDVDKQIEVYCPAVNNCETMDVMKEWAGKDSIRHLSGATIPVRHIDENTYRAEKFNKISSIPYTKSRIISLAKSGLLEYTNGRWRKSTRLKIMENTAIAVTLILLFLIYAGVTA